MVAPLEDFAATAAYSRAYWVAHQQGVPDAIGPWTVDSIYGTPGYSQETSLVVTTNAEAAAKLSDQQARKYRRRDLPPGTERLGTALVVTRE
jgi:hypothetical protein